MDKANKEEAALKQSKALVEKLKAAQTDHDSHEAAAKITEATLKDANAAAQKEVDASKITMQKHQGELDDATAKISSLEAQLKQHNVEEEKASKITEEKERTARLATLAEEKKAIQEKQTKAEEKQDTARGAHAQASTKIVQEEAKIKNNNATLAADHAKTQEHAAKLVKAHNTLKEASKDISPGKDIKTEANKLSDDDKTAAQRKTDKAATDKAHQEAHDQGRTEAQKDRDEDEKKDVAYAAAAQRERTERAAQQAHHTAMHKELMADWTPLHKKLEELHTQLKGEEGEKQKAEQPKNQPTGAHAVAQRAAANTARDAKIAGIHSQIQSAEAQLRQLRERFHRADFQTPDAGQDEDDTLSVASSEATSNE